MHLSQKLTITNLQKTVNGIGTHLKISIIR